MLDGIELLCAITVPQLEEGNFGAHRAAAIFRDHRVPARLITHGGKSKEILFEGVTHDEHRLSVEAVIGLPTPQQEGVANNVQAVPDYANDKSYITVTIDAAQADPLEILAPAPAAGIARARLAGLVVGEEARQAPLLLRREAATGNGRR